MQAQRRRLLPCSSPCGSSASGPPEMDLPDLVENTRDGTFHKDISTGSILLACRSTAHRSFLIRWRERNPTEPATRNNLVVAGSRWTLRQDNDLPLHPKVIVQRTDVWLDARFGERNPEAPRSQRSLRRTCHAQPANGEEYSEQGITDSDIPF
jgi:hypothetical protein